MSQYKNSAHTSMFAKTTKANSSSSAGFTSAVDNIYLTELSTQVDQQLSQRYVRFVIIATS
jgi:hypothetical protein